MRGTLEKINFSGSAYVVSLGIKLTEFQGVSPFGLVKSKKPKFLQFLIGGHRGFLGPNIFFWSPMVCGEILTFLDPKSISLALRMVIFSSGHK